jgi:hypothetical protein
MRFRTRRLTRYLLVGAVAAAGLGVALEIVMLQVFEARAGTGLARTTAAERGSVDLGGFPFLPSYMAQRLDEVTVEALGMSGSGMRVDRFEVRMQNVGFERGKALRLVRSRYATRMQVTGHEVIGRYEIIERDLSEFVRARVEGIRELRITSSGVEVTFDVPDEADLPPVRYLPRMRRMEEVEGDEKPMELILTLVGQTEVPQGRTADAQRLTQLISIPPLPAGLHGTIELGNGVFAVEFAGSRADVWIGAGRSEDGENR